MEPKATIAHHQNHHQDQHKDQHKDQDQNQNHQDQDQHCRCPLFPDTNTDNDHWFFDIVLLVFAIRLYAPLRASLQEETFPEVWENRIMPNIMLIEGGEPGRSRLQHSSVPAEVKHVTWVNLPIHIMFLLYRGLVGMLFASFFLETLQDYTYNKKIDLFFLNMLIDLLCCLHWLLAIDYYSSGHLEKMHADNLPNEPQSDDNPLAFDQAMHAECGFTRNMLAVVVCVVTLAQIAVSLAIDGIIVHANTTLALNPHLNFARVLLGNFFGRGVVFLNCMVICTTFVKHIMAIGVYSKSMASPEWFNPGDSEALVSRSAEVVYNIACLKSSIVTSSRKFDRMVGTILFVVPASFGCYANSLARLEAITASISSIMVLLLAMIFIMIYVILRYEELKKRMCCIVESPCFIEMFFVGRADDMRHAIAFHQRSLMTELVRDSNWMDISVLGYSVHDGALAQRAIVLGGLVFGALRVYTHNDYTGDTTTTTTMAAVF